MINQLTNSKQNNLTNHIIFVLILLANNTAYSVSPLGTPDKSNIEYPDDEPPSADEIELGKKLFFDPRLSKNNQVSCATCHNPNLGLGDGLQTSLGVNGKPLTRNSPHLYNLAWNVVYFWDGRALSLEEQVLMPIVDESEMAMPLELLTNRLQSIQGYRQNFKLVYNNSDIQIEDVAKALAAFSRSIVSDNSSFDQYINGNRAALTPSAIRGLTLFEGKAKCQQCHDGPNFTDNSFYSLGIVDKDDGRGKIVSDISLNNTFKTPGLRNTTLTAPYMHNGSIADLESVIRFYNNGGGSGKNKHELIRPLQLTDSEVADLLAFLGSLTDPVFISPPELPK